MQPPATVAQLAGEIAHSVRGCAGIAGLDPAGRYATTGVEAMHRGVRIRTGSGDATDIELELVGLIDACLPDAGAAARVAVRETLRRHGHRPGEMVLRFTDIADAPLPDRDDHDEILTAQTPEVPRRVVAATRAQPNREAVELPFTKAGDDQRVRVTVEILGDDQ